jgi:3-hydroxyisobutyrate dehydrogenase
MTKVAFIGTGGMGQGMARQLLRAGFDLAVCNRTPTKARFLVDAGARLARTPSEAAADADVIVSMVGDDHDSRQVWLGAEGVLAGEVQRQAIGIECTTLSLNWVLELAKALAAEGLGFVDSPVTGGRQAAEAGTLTMLVGAQEDNLARARPVLEAMSREIVYFGPPGAGTAYKLVVNLLVGVQSAALAEVLLMAEKAGLDMDLVVRCLTASAAASPVVKAYAGRMIHGEHGEPVQFWARWIQKDMAYGVALASELGQPVPASAAAAEVFRMALSRGLGDSNITAVIEALRQPNRERSGFS